MNDDYLSLAAELYVNGTWDKDTFKKRVTLYANEKNIDINALNEFFNRVVGKEYTIDEKRAFLSVLTLNGEELKYGNAVDTMKDDMIERFYQIEVSSLNEDLVNKYHELAQKKNEVEESKEKLEKSEELVVENSIKSEDKKTSQIKCKIVREDKTIDLPVKTVDKKENITEENIFDLPELVDESKIVITKHNKKDVKETKKTENKSNFVIPTLEVVEEKADTKQIEEFKTEEQNMDNIVVPTFAFDEEDTVDMPQKEEEFKKQEEQVTKKEKDSTVRKLEITPERLAKLKKTKNRAINYFLKGVAIITSIYCLGPIIGTGTILGYSHFAEEIKAGTFNPTNPVGKAVKHVVEKIMYMGMSKEIEKGGMSK